MSNLNLRSISNDYAAVQLASLAAWKAASEFPLRDRGGPYVVLQQGYDPEDPKLLADEFVLGRSGRWLSMSYFYRMPVPERRSEFIFNTAAEVIELMGTLPPKAELIRPGKSETGAPPADVEDEMAAAIRAAKAGTPGT